MAPSSTLQARIQAFESLNGTKTFHRDGPESDNRMDANHLESSNPPSVSSIASTLPSPPLRPHSVSPSVAPHTLTTKTSLIDLRDWVIDDGPGAMSPSKQNGSLDFETLSNGSGSRSSTNPALKKSPPSRPPAGGKRVLPPHPSQASPPLRVPDDAPLINLDSPQTHGKVKSPKAPPLPPRKQSYTSLRSVSTPTLSPISPAPASVEKDIPSPLLKPPDADHTYPPNMSKLGLNSARGHAPASSISSFHSVSLSSDGGGEHDRLASMSSVNILQTPIDDKDKEWTDGDSLDESFENVSASSFVPSLSITQYMQGTTSSKPEPPRLPQRPPTTKPRLSAPSSVPSSSTSSSPISLVSSPILTPTASGSSAATSSTNATRRAAPPPPPPTRTSRSRPPSARTSLTSTTSTSTSDRASILSYGTGTSISSSGSSAVTPKPSTFGFSGIGLGSALPMGTSRPTPVPPAARARYDALFDKTLSAVRVKRKERLTPASPPSSVKGKGRRQNGWRGLSVDLITGTEVGADDVESVTGYGEGDDDERLDGQVVKVIWMRSKLPREKLRMIWTECDSKGQGSLDRDTFARGMWKIDEELRRARLGLGRMSVTGSTARKPVKRVVSKPILR